MFAGAMVIRLVQSTVLGWLIAIALQAIAPIYLIMSLSSPRDEIKVNNHANEVALHVRAPRRSSAEYHRFNTETQSHLHLLTAFVSVIAVMLTLTLAIAIHGSGFWTFLMCKMTMSSIVDVEATAIAAWCFVFVDGVHLKYIRLGIGCSLIVLISPAIGLSLYLTARTFLQQVLIKKYPGMET
jgi:hypothetical protein